MTCVMSRSVIRGGVVALLAGLVLLIIGHWSSQAFGDEKKPVAHTRHVIVVGVAGLRWEDVSRTRTPALARLVDQGSDGTLSVRSAPSVTCPGEGWLTVGAGTYAAVVNPSDVEPDAGCGVREAPAVKREGRGAVVTEMPRIRELNDQLRFGAKPGSLGTEVFCSSAVGPGGALAAADKEGKVDNYATQLPQNPSGLLRRCPLTVVDAGAVADDASGARRQASLTAVDRQLRAIESHRPADSVIMVVGVSETDAHQPRLHVVAAEGGPFTPGWLHSPSTRRTPYVQLSDVAPTVLELLRHNVPDAMAGRPLAGGEQGRPASVDEIVRRLADTDTHAVAQRSVMVTFDIGLGALLLVALAGTLWLLVRRSRGKAVPRMALRAGGWVGLALAAVPVATFLANLVPWWRTRWPMLSIVVAVAIAAVIVLAVAALAGVVDPLRDRMRTRVIALSGVTLLVLSIDGITGCWLQMDSLLGYSPLVAGRFVGFGNIAFSVLTAAAVLFAAFLAHGHSRMVALSIVTVIALPTIAIEGLPQWGSDFGGMLTLVPAFVVIALLSAQLRVTWIRVAVSVGCGAALVLGISWLDYLRPEESRSHFGRFFQSIIDGSAFTMIHRKISANLDTLFLGPQTIAGFALVVLLIVVIFRPTRILRNAYDEMPVLRVALVGTAVAAILGFATNDSGIIIPLVMALLTGPVTLALCMWLARLGPGIRHPGGGHSARWASLSNTPTPQGTPIR